MANVKVAVRVRPLSKRCGGVHEGTAARGRGGTALRLRGGQAVGSVG